ncbi:MAG: type II/IV secretion system protein [Phycisphaerales bacterium]|nr:type II/IV secretion system protein [Phycisphaerales bacterium]
MTSAPTAPGVVGSGGGGAMRAGSYDGRAFGAMLAARKLIAEEHWRIAGEVARKDGLTELKALVDLGTISEETLADALAEHLGRPRWKPDADDAATLVLSESVPVEFMRSSGVLVLEEPMPFAPDQAGDAGPRAGARAARLVVADPSDHHQWNALLRRFPPAAGHTLAIGTHKDITRFIDERAGDGRQSGGGAAGGAGGTAAEAIDVSGELSQLRDLASTAPVIRFFHQMAERAMDLNASDIHLERFDRRVSLRFRVDGVLIDQPAPPVKQYEALLCLIKIRASLDIAERRRAQDGRIQQRLRGRAIDMRVSILPTMYGQDAAIRLQDRQRLGSITLPDLGFAPPQVTALQAVANKSHGILLITGPTGSGKTTTLYALLRSLASSELKVVTVEDPVEYAMDGINQVQVNPAINLSFSNTLRHILRHDPDVILVGEIRDHETAEMAFQAALTGHMVLSTLHTNDVPGSFVRLIDMGVQPYLVNAAVEGISAQRLMRRLCTGCGNRPDSREGCRACGGLGYRGRVAVMEFAAMNPAVKRAILEGADERGIRAALGASGFVTLREEARRLVAQGITDDAEVVRSLGESDAEDGA